MLCLFWVLCVLHIVGVVDVAVVGVIVVGVAIVGGRIVVAATVVGFGFRVVRVAVAAAAGGLPVLSAWSVAWMLLLLVLLPV